MFWVIDYEAIRRREEQNRVGGVAANIKITDFDIFKLPFDKVAYNAFMSMQAKYVLQDSYKITADFLDKSLSDIFGLLKS